MSTKFNMAQPAHHLSQMACSTHVYTENCFWLASSCSAMAEASASAELVAPRVDTFITGKLNLAEKAYNEARADYDETFRQLEQLMETSPDDNRILLLQSKMQNCERRMQDAQKDKDNAYQMLMKSQSSQAYWLPKGF